MDINEQARASALRIPEVEGPVPVTADSHPFCAMEYSRTPLVVEDYGYREEEYFISGLANVYDADECGKLLIKQSGLPYKTRLLVRYPEDKTKFSGRVYVDILNATQNYDIEDLWHRAYLWCMEYGHGYVGVTSKPICVQSLKNFDYPRYQSLNWSNGEVVPQPTISKSATLPGTEEGLVWDILSQTAALLKSNTTEIFGGCQVEYVYLCGQSQSGAYLNTYVSNFDAVLSSTEQSLYDGYMNIVGALVQRDLCQSSNTGPLKLTLRDMKPGPTPYICISSEADLTLFSMFVDEGSLLDVEIENHDEVDYKCRYYEIAGTPHTDIICPVLTALAEIEKTGERLPNLDEKLLHDLNDFPMEYYICGLLEKLHVWATEGVAPTVFPVLKRADGELQKDKYGNVLEGFRTPFTDVPIASYTACNPEDPEGISGQMKFFRKNQVQAIYGSREEYLKTFRVTVAKQVQNGWVSKTDGDKMVSWAEEKSLEVF